MPYKDPEVARIKSRERQKKYRERNKEKLRIKNLGRYHSFYKKDEAMKERRKVYLKKWRSENKEKIKKYRLNEDQIIKGRERAKRWQQENKGKAIANSRVRKSHVRRAMPNWVVRSELAKHYEESVHLEKRMGVKHHVDHIIPLIHDRVCGLHVPWNLQVIPALENLRKGNKF